MIDNTGTQCPSCKEGVLGENSIYDDWDGTVSCDKCSHQYQRWTNEHRPGIGNKDQTNLESDS